MQRQTQHHRKDMSLHMKMYVHVVYLHTLFFSFAIRTSVMCTLYKYGNVRSRRDATTATVSHTVWFKGKCGHYAQLHDKLSEQRSMYLTLNSAIDYYTKTPVNVTALNARDTVHSSLPLFSRERPPPPPSQFESIKVSLTKVKKCVAH